MPIQSSNRRSRMFAVRFVLILVVASMNSCMPTAAVLDLRTRNGSIVRDLVAKEPTAILVYAASTCFGCGTPLAYWEELARSGRMRLLVLLSGKVTDADLRNLRIQRIPALVLAEEEAKRASSLPSEFIVVDGRVEERAEGASEVRERRLWKLG